MPVNEALFAARPVPLAERAGRADPFSPLDGAEAPESEAAVVCSWVSVTVLSDPSEGGRRVLRSATGTAGSGGEPL
jgi:hypothetical protein